MYAWMIFMLAEQAAPPPSTMLKIIVALGCVIAAAAEGLRSTGPQAMPEATPVTTKPMFQLRETPVDTKAITMNVYINYAYIVAATVVLACTVYISVTFIVTLVTRMSGSLRDSTAHKKDD